MSKKRLLLISTFCFSLIIGATSSCHHSNHGHEGHNHEAEEAHAHDEHDLEAEGDLHNAGEIVLTPEKAKEAGVECQEITAGSFNEVIPVAGRILLSSSDEATVAATQPGIVKMTRAWTAGMNISAGTPLFTLSQSKLPEGDLATRARINLETARSEFDRIEKLYNRQLATISEYEAAKNAYENARLTSASLTQGGGSITAPKSGYVLECLVKDGDYVETGTPLMTITSTRRLQLQADLPIRDYGKLSQITSANFRLPQNETLYQLSSLGGRLISHAPTTEGNSAYVPLIFEFDNASGIVAGSFAEIYLLGSRREKVISVPIEALTEEQGLYYVYIREDEDCYRKRLIKKGATDGDRVEIISGLKEGENVVVKNPMAVRLASMSGAIPGHTHEH